MRKISQIRVWDIATLVIIILSGILALILRIIPVFIGDTTNVLSMVGMDDPMYNLRQIEQMIHNYPAYSWFEAMSYYPEGAPIHWGPLFAFIGATWCIIWGAVERPDLIATALYIAPLMAVVMVPLMYVLVHRISDRLTGVVAAVLIAIVPGQYFYRSYYGYLDHHIAEVLFSTIYCLCFIICLIYVRMHPVSLKSRESLKKPVLLGVVAGIAYTLGLAVMPTMILFAMITAFFTFFWFIYDKIEKKNADSVLVVICSTFGTAIVGYLVIGVHQEGLLLNYYTISHLLVYGLIIITTLLLFGLSRLLKDKSIVWYILSFLCFIGLSLVAFCIAAPDMYQLFANSLSEFFGTNIYYSTIQEARPWTLGAAWNAFSWSLVLMIGGLIYLVYRIIKKQQVEDFFIFIWSVIIIYAAFQHIRYEYYFAVPLVILVSLLIGYLASPLKQEIMTLNWRRTQEKKEITDKKPKHISGSQEKRRGLSLVLFLLVLALTLLFVSDTITNVTHIGVLELNPEWHESLVWMEKNTPDTGVDYLRIYNPDAWTPPATSYGVMSWWDYGHMITFIAKRLPHANPFQQGVAGPTGAAAFFTATTEDAANGIADTLNTRYIMTDIEMDTGKFWAMATWDDSSSGIAPYMQEFLFPDPEGNRAMISMVYKQPYYETMVSRLHNFDGSLVVPENVTFVEYITPDSTGYPYPLITNALSLPYPAATAMVEQYKATAPEGYGGVLISDSFYKPAVPVPALMHYRLVHESPSRTTPAGHPDIRYVKIFEYVPGAVIPGDGVIELTLVTDSGRTFYYRQESEGGQFIVPYPTETKTGDVTALGQYRNLNTGETYSVTEAQVQGKERISP